MSSLAVNKSVIGKEAEHLVRAFSRALSVPLVAVQFSSGLKGAGSSCKIVYVSAARIKRSAEILCSPLILEADEASVFSYTLGAVKDRNEIKTAVQEAFMPDFDCEALKQIKTKWRKYTDCFSVISPDENVNRFVNIWNAYQAKTTFDWSRFISLYERGVDRGFGFRDSMQDVLGVIHAVPAEAKARIKLLLSIQLSEGDAKAVYFPSNGSTAGGGRSDDHL